MCLDLGNFRKVERLKVREVEHIHAIDMKPGL